MLLSEPSRDVPMTRWRAGYDLALLSLLAAAVALAAFGDGPLRALLVFVAAMFVPGAALLTRFADQDPLTHAALAIAISIALVTLSSSALAFAGWWHPEVLGGALAGGAAVLLLCDAWSDWHSHRLEQRA